MTKLKKTFIGIAVAMAVLISLAIVIPNLQRSRMSGPSAGASTVRSINTAQITYATTYPKIGYAPNLAVLGPAESGNCDSSHACLLDLVTACPQGIGEGWCVKDFYRYNIQTSSTEPPYRDYWITATPIRPDPTGRNYCSASDAVIRSEQAAPLSRPYTLEDCQALPEIH